MRVRHDLGLPPEAPLDPLQVCRHYDIEVIPLSKLGTLGDHFLQIEPSAFSAVTVPCGLRCAIIHNDGHAPVRQRSNLAHEIAHGLLGHKAMPPLTTDGERHFDGGIEAEANFLGGTLLITNEAAWHIVSRDLRATACDLYGVSQVMLEYRLRISGVLKRAARRWGLVE